jgi:DNA replication and repair protein RecF
MKLKKICIFSFRNIDEIELSPNERFNIFAGNNAQGKTNILESIYLLGAMKSFRMTRNSELVKNGSPHSIIKGSVSRDCVTREIALYIEPSGKKVKVDNKTVSRLSDFFGCINMVVFSPEDTSMVRGLPESRRRYLDRAVFSSDFRYLATHHEYLKILKNRNSLLKSAIISGLDVWTERLAAAGARLMKARISYIEEISALLADFYAIIAGRSQFAAIRYSSEAIRRDYVSVTSDDIMYGLLEVFSRKSAEERHKGTTLAGPHRDDIEFYLNGRILKLHGSQGELRSFILALKMAEIEYIKRRHIYPPVLLLDDMTSELDGDRNRNFLDFLKSREMQVFITTTSLNNLCLPESINQSVFTVQGGKILQ